MTTMTTMTTCRSTTIRLTHTGDLDIYIIICFSSETNLPCELFIKLGKEGSTLAGMVAALANLVSLALQHGVPWPTIATKLSGNKFEPLNNFGESLVEAIVTAIDKELVYPTPD